MNSECTGEQVTIIHNVKPESVVRKDEETLISKEKITVVERLFETSS